MHHRCPTTYLTANSTVLIDVTEVWQAGSKATKTLPNKETGTARPRSHENP